MGALGIDRSSAETLLWEAPRSLLLEAVPTLVRRLFRGWQLAIPNAGATLDLQVDHHPLPDFIPRNLFSDLSRARCAWAKVYYDGLKSRGKTHAQALRSLHEVHLDRPFRNAYTDILCDTSL